MSKLLLIWSNRSSYSRLYTYNLYSSAKFNCRCLSKRKSTPHQTACQPIYIIQLHIR